MMKRKIWFIILIPVVQGIVLCNGMQTNNYLSIMTFILIECICTFITWRALENKRECLNQKKYILLIIAIMVLADQLMKVIISSCLDTDITIIPNILKLRIARNYFHTAMFSFLKIDIEYIYICIFKLILIIITILAYRLCLKRNDTIYIRMAFIMMFSSVISNFMDSCIWGYTLDYINYCGVMTMDLKDIYVDVGLGIGIYYFFENDLDKIISSIQGRKLEKK